MRLDVRSPQRLEHGLREAIRRRLQFVLGRYGPRLGRVTVHLTGPADGATARCRVVAGLVPEGEVRIDVHEADARTALEHAAARLGPAVARALRREPA
jgi:hypothetical protein